MDGFSYTQGSIKLKKFFFYLWMRDFLLPPCSHKVYLGISLLFLGSRSMRGTWGLASHL